LREKPRKPCLLRIEEKESPVSTAGLDVGAPGIKTLPAFRAA
jgi:hypothetical protein